MCNRCTYLLVGCNENEKKKMELKIISSKENAGELKSILKKENIEIKEKNILFNNPELNAGFDIPTAITIIIGTTTFWTALATVLKQAITKEPIEIEFTDSKSEKVIKLKANSLKELEGVLKKVKEHNKSNENEKPN